MNLSLNLVTILLSTCLLYSCASTSNIVFDVDKDVSEVPLVIQSVATTLNMETLATADSITSYVWKYDGNPVHAFKPVVSYVSPNKSRVSLFAIAQYQSVADNLALTHKSFILQKADPTFLGDSSLHFLFQPKSIDEVNRRNWISPALAIAYAGRDNPFVDRADYTVGMGFTALLDVVHAGLILGGPFIGKTPKDGVEISLIGVAGAIAWRLIGPVSQCRRDVELFNNVVSSGYMLPGQLKQ